MKVFFSLLLVLGMAVPVLGQGKVRLVNDSLHLVYFATDTSRLNDGDAALAGQPYTAGDAGQFLRVDLWAGTSSTALSLQGTTDFSGQPSPGTWSGVNITMPSVPAGPAFFVIDVYDGAAGSYSNAAVSFGHYYGTSGMFTANASGTVAYNFLANHNSPVNSTWADGTHNMDFILPGFRGAIVLVSRLGPEPSTFALSCLSLALLLLRRRAEARKLEK